MKNCTKNISIKVDSISEASLYLKRIYGAQLIKLEKKIDEDVLVGIISINNNFQIELVQDIDNNTKITKIFGEKLSDLYSTNIKQMSS